jgi:hypothetical protein
VEVGGCVLLGGRGCALLGLDWGRMGSIGARRAECQDLRGADLEAAISCRFVGGLAGISPIRLLVGVGAGLWEDSMVTKSSLWLG